MKFSQKKETGLNFLSKLSFANFSGQKLTKEANNSKRGLYCKDHGMSEDKEIIASTLKYWVNKWHFKCKNVN